jgi:hypothetical protein
MPHIEYIIVSAGVSSPGVPTQFAAAIRPGPLAALALKKHGSDSHACLGEAGRLAFATALRAARETPGFEACHGIPRCSWQPAENGIANLIQGPDGSAYDQAREPVVQELEALLGAGSVVVSEPWPATYAPEEKRNIENDIADFVDRVARLG